MSDHLFLSQKPQNAQGEQIETKFQTRQESLFGKESFSEIKEESMNKELSLGKSIREKIFTQKRLKQKINNENTNSNNEKIKDRLTIPPEFYYNCINLNVDIYQLKDIVFSFNSNDLKQKFAGLVGIRKLLCIADDPPIEIILEMNVLPSLIELLGNSPVEFQYEALWCLINITSGTDNQVKILKNEGGIEKILELLDHNLNEIKELAIWNIENIAIDSIKMQQFLIEKKIINKVITILSLNNNEAIITHSISLLKIILKNNITCLNENVDVKMLINSISKIIMSIKFNADNKDVCQLFNDCFYLLSHISEKLKECKDYILENGVIPYILEIIRNNNNESNASLILYGLKIIGNIISGNVNQTQKMLDYNIYDILKIHMFNHKKGIKKEANWIISNIASDTEAHIKDLIDNGFFQLIYQIFEKEDRDVRIEAAWALCNFSQIKDKNYILTLIDQGLLNIIYDCMKSSEIKEIAISIEALYNLLVFGKENECNGKNLVALELEKRGMLDVLENLQFHRSELVYEKVIKIIETFFHVEEV